MFLQWRDIYKVGIEEVDEQHMKLFAIVNDLHDGLNNGIAQANLNTIFGQLLEYAVDHFSYEESLLEKMSYPNSQKHKDEHEAFIARINHCQYKAKMGQLLISMRLLDFLKIWIIDHNLGSDQEFAQFLKENCIDEDVSNEALLKVNIIPN